MSAIDVRPHLVERAMEAMGGTLARRQTDGPVGPAPRPLPPPSSPVVQPVPAAAVGSAGLAAPAVVAPPAVPTIAPVPLQLLLDAGLAGVPGGARSRVSEEFSVVQQQVLRTLAAEGEGRVRSQVIMITSARPGEGKTFSALNIAGSLAASGARPVLLVDTDAKHHSLSDLLGLGEANGLRTLAAEPGRPLNTILVPTAIERLRILPHGRAASATVSGAAIAAAVLRLAALLPDHAIVLDTPPCLSTSDPGMLAPVAGQVILVVEAEATPRNEVEAALDMVEACPVLQLLLNRTRLGGNDSFGAYYGSAYYGG